jgi:pimeloyl-ACP methyl ester carboxylesterase
LPTVEVDGVNLYYELHGPEEAPVLVLNNGVIMNAASSWIFQTEALSQDYRLLQYDCRGQGMSDHPPGLYSMEQHAEDLAGLFEALEFDLAHIAGISYGGEVAQAFALAFPDFVKSLILIDTVSEVGPELELVIRSWMDTLRVEDPLAFFHATVPWNFSPEFIAANQPLLEDARQRYTQLDFSAVLALCESFLKVHFTHRLGEIKVPTCILVGECDLIKGPRYAEILRQGIPHAEFHSIEGAGHATCWEKPREFNTIILNFLAKVEGESL